MAACEHPYELLEIIPSASTRGSAATAIRATCLGCEKIVHGGVITKFVTGMRSDLDLLRQALAGAGVELSSPAMRGPSPTRRRGEPKRCLHFLGWLEIDTAGLAPVRGHKPSNSIRCVSCGETWPDCSALLAVMKKEIGKLWIELRKLEAR